MKKGMVITAVVLLLTGLILFGTAFVLGGFDFPIHGNAKLTENIYMENTYSVDQTFTKIEIDASETDIRFSPGKDGNCAVICEEPDKVTYTAAVEDGTLKIAVDDRRTWADRLMLFSRTPVMTVCLTEDAYEALRIVSHTGDVSIPEGFIFGSIDVTLSTGDVACSASANGPVTIKTSTGDVTCDACTAGQLRIETSTGDVRLNTCDAESILIKTSTGDVTGTLRSEKVFLVKTSTGKVDVPESGSGGKCEITTSTGDIRIELAGE